MRVLTRKTTWHHRLRDCPKKDALADDRFTTNIGMVAMVVMVACIGVDWHGGDGGDGGIGC